jgi:mannitol-1-/sugar-/sorbitol-6-/2-deoxyglucose-6-phosphatase
MRYFSRMIDLFASPCRAIIFDMDGLIIDSEPYWKQAEKLVFGKLGLALTDQMLQQVMGFRLNEVVKYWYDYQPWPQPDLALTEKDVTETVKKLILNHAEAMPGLFDLLKALSQTDLKLAIASSSSMSLIQAVVQKLGIEHYFDVLWSAEYESFGKPHPAIFLSTANKLNVAPNDCWVIEDSLNGVIAAKAARMKCLAVPDVSQLQDPRFSIADKVISSLEKLASSEGYI